MKLVSVSHRLGGFESSLPLGWLVAECCVCRTANGNTVSVCLGHVNGILDQGGPMSNFYMRNKFPCWKTASFSLHHIPVETESALSASQF